MSLRKKILLAAFLLPLVAGLLPRLYFQLLPCPVFNGVDRPVPTEVFKRFERAGIDVSNFLKTEEYRVPFDTDGPRYVSRLEIFGIRTALSWTVFTPEQISEIIVHSPDRATALTAEDTKGFQFSIELLHKPFWHVSQRHVSVEATSVKPAKGISLPFQPEPTIEQTGTIEMGFGKALLVRFSNPTRKPIKTYGYLSQLAPFVEFQTYRDSCWQKIEPGHCGTGAGNLIFEPGSLSEYWTSGPRTNGVYRAGVSFSVGKQTTTVWSSEIHWTNSASSTTSVVK